MDVKQVLGSLSLGLASLSNMLMEHKPVYDFSGSTGKVLLEQVLDQGKPVLADGGASKLYWLYVPSQTDSVLIKLNHTNPRGTLLNMDIIRPGGISYVSGYDPDILLPRELFFWRRAWVAKGSQDFGRKSLLNSVSSKPSSDDHLYEMQDGKYKNKKTGREYIAEPGQLPPQDSAVEHWFYHEIVDRNLAFESLMGMSEEKFRSDILGISPTKHLDVSQAIKSFENKRSNLQQRANACFPMRNVVKDFKAIDVCQLRRDYIVDDKNGKYKKLRGSGRLFIMKKSDFDAFGEGYKTDIRYLQTEFNGAVFQIASTFSCMEGGVRYYDRMLNEMNTTPVQGENAVIATISGAIVRRYFVPTKERNLLVKLSSVFGIKPDSWAPKVIDISYKDIIKSSYYITSDDREKELVEKEHKYEIAFQLALAGGIAVGVHRNLMVTSGSWGPDDIEIPRIAKDGKKTSMTVPAFDRKINDVVKVHHIYTSAIDLAPMHLYNSKSEAYAQGVLRAKQLKEGNAMLPRIALRAAYEGAILAAAKILLCSDSPESIKNPVAVNDLQEFLDKNNAAPRLFLTLVGAGAFKNQAEWIIDVLEDLKALISDLGLQVCLVLWGNESIHKPLGEIVNDINHSRPEHLSTKRELMWHYQLRENSYGLSPLLDIAAKVSLPNKYKKDSRETTLFIA